MKNSRHDLDKSDLRIKSEDDKTDFPSGSIYSFQNKLKIEGIVKVKVVTGAGWLLELFKLQAGELSFIRGEAQVRPKTKCFGVFYPPFSISQSYFKNARGYVIGCAATEPMSAEFMTKSVTFETTFTGMPSGSAQIVEILRRGENFQSIETNPSPSSLSLKAKKLIDETYLARQPIARIASRVDVSHEHLSRNFKRDYGMSPNAYRHQLRVADAPLLFVQGEEIINVSQSVGYNDLSRFYKQFRKITKTSPGVCQTMMKDRRI